jgi:hypothetical protein
MTFWIKAERYPPILCRLLARHTRGKPLTTEEITQRSGLPRMAVLTLSFSATWAGTDLPTMRKFLQGCGIDFCNRTQFKRRENYLALQARLAGKNCRNWAYLRASPEWGTFYEPMMRTYIQSRV